MKINTISYFTLAIFLLASCSNESEEAFGFTDGPRAVAIPNIGEVNQGFFNLLDIQNAYVEFQLDVVGNASSVDILMNYEGSSYILVQTVSEFPSTVRIELPSVASQLSVDLESLDPGDSFGTIFETTVGAKVYDSGVAFGFLTACPSEIPEGTYTATSGGASTDSCPPNNPLVGLSYEVTLTDTGSGTYTISDFAAGVYQDWYGECYGYTFETEASIVDVCNGLSMNLTDAFGSSVTGSGEYNPETGVLTMEWSNDFGDTGFWSLTAN